MDPAKWNYEMDQADSYLKGFSNCPPELLKLVRNCARGTHEWLMYFLGKTNQGQPSVIRDVRGKNARAKS